MKHLALILTAAALAFTTTACGGGEVTVLAQLQGEDTGTEEAGAVALGSLPVELIPFDRDVVFDSLAEAYPEPEPEIPDTIFDLQQRVEAEYEEWQQAEDRWATVRDSLQRLAEQMEGMSPQSGEYHLMFQDFTDLEGEVGALERRMNTAFEEFTTLQTQLNRQAQEITLAREAWANEAFAPIDSIFSARLEEMGLEILTDTTSAQGVATFPGVDAGQWWVHARYDRQFDELYWNVPIEVTRGEELQVRLTEENAEVRQKM